MSLSLFDLSAPIFIRCLNIAGSYLDKVASFSTERKIDPTVLLNARLAPDMFSFSGQLQRLSDTAKGAMARLAAVDAPPFADTETTIEQLHQRIAKTVSFVQGVKRELIEGHEDRSIEIKAGFIDGALSVETYLLEFALPNFFFHMATAHDILRHNGVVVGKADYIGPLTYLK